MFSVILVIHLIVTVCLVGIILLQRSEGGGLGISGGGNMGAMAPRAQADVLTKTTGILAAIFMVTSLTLVIMATHGSQKATLIDQLKQPTAAESPAGIPPMPAAQASTPVAPSAPAAPEVPRSK